MQHSSVQRAFSRGRAIQVFAIAATLPLIQSCARWKDVTPAGGGFAVKMPSDVSCNFFRGPEKFGGLPGSSCDGDDDRFRARSFGIYRASGYALPPNQDLAAVKRERDEELGLAAREPGVVLVAGDQRTLGGVTWSEVTAEGGANDGRFRTVLLFTALPQGVFSLSVTGPADAWPTQEAKRFFDSFRFRGRPGEFHDAPRQ